MSSTTARGTRPHVPGLGAFVAIAMAAGTALAPQSAIALTSYEATVICPIDGQAFVTTMTGSTFQSGMRLDFKPIGALIAPYPYPVCPGNGFVVYRNDFSDSELHAIRTIVLGDEYRRLRSEDTDYFMVAYVKQRLGADDYDLGSTYLRASWEAERNAPHLTGRYQELALEKFGAFTQGKRTHTEEWWTASVLAAELDRLLARFDAVERRFNALPLAELNASHPALRNVLDQIRMLALRHNSEPEEMDSRGFVDGTVGLKDARM